MKRTISALLAFTICVYVSFIVGGAAIWAANTAYGHYVGAVTAFQAPQNRAKAHLATINGQAATVCVPLDYGTSTSSDLDEYTCRVNTKIIRCLAGRVLEQPTCKVIVDLAPAQPTPPLVPPSGTPGTAE